MKSAFIRICLFLGITCFVFSVDCQAQGTRIAIVSVADTTCVHRHVGLTIFTNFCDTIQMNFPLLQQMEGKLMAYLNTNYTASVVQLPDSVLKVKNTFFRQSRTKKIEQWIKNSKDQYDLVIVMDNMELSENDRLVPKSTSGIFSRTYFASYYTTISFFAYRTSNLKQLEYYHQGGNFILQK